MKKETPMLAGAVATILVIAVIMGATNSGHKCDDACKYGTEAVEVLENYKKGSVTPEELKKRIDKLANLLNEEEGKATSGSEASHRIFSIRTELISIQIKLSATNYVLYYEVDEAINNIKENL